MKRALGTIGTVGMAAGLLLGAGPAWANGANAQGKAGCVPMAQSPQPPQPSRQQSPQLTNEDWQGLYEYQLSGEPMDAADAKEGVAAGQGATMRVSGEVARVNLTLGEVGLYSNGHFVTLHATPAQLVQLKPGTIVQLDYVNQGGVLRMVGP